MVLPWMPRLPWLRRQMVLTMAGLKGGFWKDGGQSLFGKSTAPYALG
jgi:hypothetical protein